MHHSLRHKLIKEQSNAYIKWNHIGNKMIDQDKWWRISVGLKGYGRNVPRPLLVSMPAINLIILSLVSWPIRSEIIAIFANWLPTILSGLPRLLLAGRFFTCFGLVFLGFGALINIFGLSCIQTNQTDQMKAKVSVGAGFLVLLGSLSIGKLYTRTISNSRELLVREWYISKKRIYVKIDLLFNKWFIILVFILQNPGVWLARS